MSTLSILNNRWSYLLFDTISKQKLQLSRGIKRFNLKMRVNVIIALKVGIDVQALQTPGTKKRGIGRYTQNLFSYLIDKDKENRYVLLLNDCYSEKINLPKLNNISLLKLKYFRGKNDKKTNIMINEIAQFFQYSNAFQDIILIPSPFEVPTVLDLATNKYPTVCRFCSRLSSVIIVILHDLIPLIFPDIYLTSKIKKDFYFSRLEVVKQSDMILTISESTRNDAITLLEIDPKKIVNIGAASSSDFHRINSVIDEKKILKKYSIKKPFILYSGGYDFRKNLERAIEAFSKIKHTLLESHQFVIVCDIDGFQKNKLEKLSEKFGVKDKVIITGYIPDYDLNVLYNTCKLFFFPSTYEGVGLPILEAMSCGAPVIASNTSSMMEIIQKKEFTFDPYDIEEITNLISKGIEDNDFRIELKNHSLSQSKNFSWERTAQIVLDQYSKIQNILDEKRSKDDYWDHKNSFNSTDQMMQLVVDELDKAGIYQLDESHLHFISQSILHIVKKNNY